jgi:hypothetical protein
MSRAVAGTDIDKPLGRGYALVIDTRPLGAMLLAGATVGVAGGVFTCARTGNVVVLLLVDYGSTLMRFLPHQPLWPAQ